MFPSTTSEWIAFVGILIPLFVLAFSLAAHVWNQYLAHTDREFKRFFELTDAIGKPGSSIVSQTAAVYELRKYKKYKGVIIRICDGKSIEGESAKLLNEEFNLTKQYFLDQ